MHCTYVDLLSNINSCNSETLGFDFHLFVQRHIYSGITSVEVFATIQSHQQYIVLTKSRSIEKIC